MEKKNVLIITVIAVLSILVGLLGGYFLSNTLTDKNQGTNSNADNNNNIDNEEENNEEPGLIRNTIKESDVYSAYYYKGINSEYNLPEKIEILLFKNNTFVIHGGVISGYGYAGTYDKNGANIVLTISKVLGGDGCTEIGFNEKVVNYKLDNGKLVGPRTSFDADEKYVYNKISFKDVSTDVLSYARSFSDKKYYQCTCDDIDDKCE